MDNKEVIIEFFTEIATSVAQIDDVVDKAFEPVKDYTDTLGDLVAPIKTMQTVLNFSKKMKVKMYAKEYAKKINNGQNIDENQSNKLEKYMSKEINREFMGQVIDSAINSKSNKCSAILGYYTGKILNELVNVEYKDMIIVNALRCMNDYDLKYFCMLYEYIKNEKSKDGVSIFLLNKDDESKLGFNILIVGQKFKSIQVISSDENEVFPGGELIFIGIVTEITEYLYKIIKESRIELI